jgi:hypothetical protein
MAHDMQTFRSPKYLENGTWQGKNSCVLLPPRRDPSLFPFRFISPWATTALSSTNTSPRRQSNNPWFNTYWQSVLSRDVIEQQIYHGVSPRKVRAPAVFLSALSERHARCYRLSRGMQPMNTVWASSVSTLPHCAWWSLVAGGVSARLQRDAATRKSLSIPESFCGEHREMVQSQILWEKRITLFVPSGENPHFTALSASGMKGAHCPLTQESLSAVVEMAEVYPRRLPERLTRRSPMRLPMRPNERTGDYRESRLPERTMKGLPQGLPQGLLSRLLKGHQAVLLKGLPGGLLSYHPPYTYCIGWSVKQISKK